MKFTNLTNQMEQNVVENSSSTNFAFQNFSMLNAYFFKNEEKKNSQSQSRNQNQTTTPS